MELTEIKNQIDEMSANLVEQINQALSGKTAVFKGQPIIIDTDANPVTAMSIADKIDFKLFINDKFYSLTTLINNKILKLDETTSNKIAEIFIETPTINQLIKEKKCVEFAEAERKRAEAEAAKKAKIKAENEAKKAEQIRASAIKAAESLSKSRLSDDDELFMTIGYIAKNMTTLTAKLPDFLDHWFVKEFGDAKRTVIDTTRRTAGGNVPQWSLSLKLTVLMDETAPAMLQSMLSKPLVPGKVNTINNTAFLFGLCKEYGFVFGKACDQNFGEIEAEVKSHGAIEVENYEAGYELASRVVKVRGKSEDEE